MFRMSIHPQVAKNIRVGSSARPIYMEKGIKMAKIFDCRGLSG